MTVIPAKKQHFLTLDLLRGVAALAVLLLHWFEGTGSPWFGYSHLAVDFFFMLSGFVIAYSYDDRMRKGMKFKDFFIARIIRLYPLILAGIIFGVIRFVMKDFVTGESEVPMSEMPTLFIMNLFMIPNFQNIANAGMFPINLALWSLFFEFIGYALYGLFYYRARNLALVLTILAGLVGVASWLFIEFGPERFTVPFLDIFKIGYFSGLSRLVMGFFIGVFLFRNFETLKRFKFGNPLVLSILSFALFAIPHGVLPSIVVLTLMFIVFPMIVVSGASASLSGQGAVVGKFLGDLSYPLYVLHTPMIWVMGGVFKFAGLEKLIPETWFGLVILPVTIVISYIVLKIYDEPVRAFLTAQVKKRRPVDKTV